jgi:hypothetical protein
MDVSLVMKRRLSELCFDQRDLAVAVLVTDSYIPQLLARKNAPPAPGRTDPSDRMGEFLKLPGGGLSRIASVQRREELHKRGSATPSPLFQECRELVLHKCETARQKEMRRIFGKFVEQEPAVPLAQEAGFEQFLRDRSLSGDASEEEIEFLKGASSRESRLQPFTIIGSSKA